MFGPEVLSESVVVAAVPPTPETNPASRRALVSVLGIQVPVVWDFKPAPLRLRTRNLKKTWHLGFGCGASTNLKMVLQLWNLDFFSCRCKRCLSIRLASGAQVGRQGRVGKG